jgi:hypothetical protein
MAQRWPAHPARTRYTGAEMVGIVRRKGPAEGIFSLGLAPVRVAVVTAALTTAPPATTLTASAA